MELQKTVESILYQVLSGSKERVVIQGKDFTQDEVLQTLDDMHWQLLADFERTKGEWTYHYKKDGRHLAVDTMYYGDLMILHCNYKPTANIDNLISKKIEMLFNSGVEYVYLPKYLIPDNIRSCLTRLGWDFVEVNDRYNDSVYYLYEKEDKRLMLCCNGLYCEYKFYEYID